MTIRPRRGTIGALLSLAAAAAARGAEPDLESVIKSSLGQRHWYGVYVSGTKSGYALIECLEGKVGDRPAVVVDMKMRLKLVTMGQKQDVRVFEKRTYFRTGELHEVAFRFKSDASEMRATATVQGDKALLSMQMGELAPQTKELPKPQESLRDWAAAEWFAASASKPGEQVTFSLLEPMMLKEFQGTLTFKERKEIIFNGVPTRVTVLGQRVAELGMDGDVVVDARGVALEQTVGQMFVLRLESERQAKDVQYSGDLVRTGCVTLDKPPHNPAALRSAKFEIRGIEDAALLVNDNRQRWSEGKDGARIVEVVAEGVPAQRLARLPVDRAKFAADLAPTMFVQCDEPAIKSLAAEIVGNERDLWAAARKINAWVYKNVRKVGTAAMSNAAEVVKAREGDCSEHTVLFVALARAAGIPARELAGVTAIEKGEGLYYHAWPEVWVGDWVAMDPTLGQEVADPTHIVFARGGAESFYRILSVFGRLRARMVESTSR